MTRTLISKAIWGIWHHVPGWYIWHGGRGNNRRPCDRNTDPTDSLCPAHWLFCQRRRSLIHCFVAMETVTVMHWICLLFILITTIHIPIDGEFVIICIGTLAEHNKVRWQINWSLTVKPPRHHTSNANCNSSNNTSQPSSSLWGTLEHRQTQIPGYLNCEIYPITTSTTTFILCKSTCTTHAFTCVMYSNVLPIYYILKDVSATWWMSWM